MPKIRGVHPEFWTDEDIVELTLPARLLFIGLWNFACDNGHLDDKPKQIKMRVMPSDDVDVDALLDELVWHKRIQRKDGTITIRKFAEHQKPHKRWWKTCHLDGCTVPEDAPPQGRNGGKGASTGPDNGGATVAQPVNTRGATADVDGEGDGEREGEEGSCASADAERVNPSDTIGLDFEEWYATYPRKRGKGQALKAYRAARKKTDHATLLDAITRQAGALLAKGADFCPYPATWLNGERWADQPDSLLPAIVTPITGRNAERAAMHDRQMERAIERERQMGLRP